MTLCIDVRVRFTSVQLKCDICSQIRVLFVSSYVKIYIFHLVHLISLTFEELVLSYVTN